MSISSRRTVLRVCRRTVAVAAGVADAWLAHNNWTTIEGSPHRPLTPISAPITRQPRLATRNPGRTEADIQSDVKTVLMYGGFDLAEQDVRLEAPTADRHRLDISAGNLIVECKRIKRSANQHEHRATARRRVAGLPIVAINIAGDLGRERWQQRPASQAGTLGEAPSPDLPWASAS